MLTEWVCCLIGVPRKTIRRTWCGAGMAWKRNTRSSRGQREVHWKKEIGRTRKTVEKKQPATDELRLTFPFRSIFVSRCMIQPVLKQLYNYIHKYQLITEPAHLLFSCANFRIAFFTLPCWLWQNGWNVLSGISGTDLRSISIMPNRSDHIRPTKRKNAKQRNNTGHHYS